jgi:hypothetical protein
MRRAAQAGGEEDKDDRAIAPGAPSGLDGNSALGGDAPTGVLVKAFEAVTEVFERANLVVVEGARLQRRQAEFADALGVDPGREGGEGGEVIVDGGRGELLIVLECRAAGTQRCGRGRSAGRRSR